jgi:quinol-cytochrome oxidoreductase complex cytochrome b subunit
LKSSSPVLKGIIPSNRIAHPTEERLEVQKIVDDISRKYMPPYGNIFYCLGGPVFLWFLIQVATGFAMTFYYRPSVLVRGALYNVESFGYVILF